MKFGTLLESQWFSFQVLELNYVTKQYYKSAYWSELQGSKQYHPIEYSVCKEWQQEISTECDFLLIS